jgi:NADH dehydrogenase
VGTLHRIVFVGGGAGGLELATRLGDTLGSRGKADITLVDRHATHVWKPLLHEFAAGSMDINAHQLDYLAQARWHHFSFCCGALAGLDRARREIRVAALHDADGSEIIPQRTLGYDTLVLAIGSVSNTFNVPGVAEHAYMLDSAPEADRFHRRLITACAQANYKQHNADDPPLQLNITIVGGGATGVELAAELHNTTRLLAAYGLTHIAPEHFLNITLLDAGPRILPMLPERIAAATTDTLRSLGISVNCQEQATQITADAVHTKSGRAFAADIAVWAAGIRGDEVLRDLDGLEANRINQLLVLPTLQTTRDADIFALGDCIACPRDDAPGGPSRWPPAAQAAHQQASHLRHTITRRLAGKPPRPFVYRDFGSLVSLGEYSTVGSLMGFLSGRSMRVEGLFARIMYLSLYKMHLYALHGAMGVLLDSLARMLKRGTEPRVKLH